MVGVCLLGTGAALVVHIVSGVSLRVALALAVSLMAAVVASIWRRATATDRQRLLSRLRVGVTAGFGATIIYDTSKFLLSQLDPSPYNPFEVLRIFGHLRLKP